MTYFSLRKATQADAGRIRQLVIDGGINPFGLDWRRFIVAEDGSGRVIGCVQRKYHRDGSAELASLAVDEAQRGRGAARTLIEALMAIHGGGLYLMCRSGLGEFYRRFGFRALDADEMPPYFRRISRLMNWLTGLLGRREGLLIMVQNCGSSEVDRFPHLVG